MRLPANTTTESRNNGTVDQQRLEDESVGRSLRILASRPEVLSVHLGCGDVGNWSGQTMFKDRDGFSRERVGHGELLTTVTTIARTDGWGGEPELTIVPGTLLLAENDRLLAECARLRAEVARLEADNRRLRVVYDAAERWLSVWVAEGADGHPDEMTAEPDWPEIEMELVTAIDEARAALEGDGNENT